MSRRTLDALLDEVGPANGPETEVDPRWEALAHGALDDDDAKSLFADQATEAEAEVFPPLGEAFVRRVLLRAEQERWVAPPVAVPVPEPSLLQRVRAWLVNPMFVAPMLAVAMAVLFVRPASDPLPAYTMSVAGGDRASRGSEVPTGGLRLSDGSALTVVLRPDVQGERVFAAVFRVGAVEPIPADITTDEGGAVKVVLTVGPALPAGAVDLRLVVRADAPPTADDLARQDSASVQVFPIQLEHVP